MSKKTLWLVAGAAALYFFMKSRRPAAAVMAVPRLKSAPTDSMAAATMPGAVQGLITDGARQADVASMQGFFY